MVRRFRPNLTHCGVWSCHLMSSDFKRFACVGISSFFVSGPLSFTVNRIVYNLYPGYGRFSLLKRIVITNCLSPLTIASGIIPSVYLQTRDPETVRVDVREWP